MNGRMVDLEDQGRMFEIDFNTLGGSKMATV
jgi:hypothetical protein